MTFRVAFKSETLLQSTPAGGKVGCIVRFDADIGCNRFLGNLVTVAVQIRERNHDLNLRVGRKILHGRADKTAAGRNNVQGALCAVDRKEHDVVIAADVAGCLDCRQRRQIKVTENSIAFGIFR